MGLAKILGFKRDEPAVPKFLVDGSLVDIEQFESPKTVVKVNGKATPLSVGDVMICPGGENSPFLVTIGSIVVGAEGKVSYICEWNSPTDGTAMQDMMTLEELKRFIRRNTI